MSKGNQKRTGLPVIHEFAAGIGSDTVQSDNSKSFHEIPIVGDRS